jgi:hypothetical protein
MAYRYGYQRASLGLGQGRPFNMDAITLERLNDKLNKSNDAGIEGNLLARFRALELVYIDTIFKYSDEEIDDLEAHIKAIREQFKQGPEAASRPMMQQFVNHKIAVLEVKIGNFEKALIRLLYKHNIINLKKIKHKPLDEEIDSDYE